MRRRQLRGVESIAKALDSGEDLSLLLVVEGARPPAVDVLVARAGERGIPVLVESAREMRRMSGGPVTEDLLALSGPSISTDLDELMTADGLVLVLVRLRYPGNVGYILRCAEVAGAAGVVVDGDWGDAQRDEALRVAMRPDRFFPVLHASADAALAAARRAGRALIAIETSGDSAPWDVDLSSPVAVVVGSETTGIPTTTLQDADAVVRIPSHGFIPSYNVQAAVGIMLGEWLRQKATIPAATTPAER